MAGTTVRVTARTHSRLRELAAERHVSLQAVLAEAVDQLWRNRLLDSTNQAYAALRADPTRRQAELEERQAWEATLSDNLEPE